MFDIHRTTLRVGVEGSLFSISSGALVDGMLSVASSSLSPMTQLCGLERRLRSARTVLASFALVLIATGCGNAGEVSMGGESLPVSSARTEQVVDDLRAYIPDRMESEGVPGLGVTLIEDGEIVWEAAFGVSNTLSGNLVATESVFEVESIGKPVAAYAALKLVESGALELDKPIHMYLDQSWLPGSEWSDQITLRQLLSHTSGLSNRLHPIDKSISFEPGDHFSYSNVGFQYLQAVIEAVADSSLDGVVHDTTFSPLAMSSSTFADRSDVTSRLVFGHINYGALLAPLVAVVFLWFAVIAVVAAVVQRIRTGHLALTGRLLGACYAAAAVLSLPVVAWFNGGINKWSFFLTLVLAALSIWLAAWVAGSRLVLRRLPQRWQSKSRRRALGVASILLCITAFALVANAISGPVPRWPRVKAWGGLLVEVDALRSGTLHDRALGPAAPGFGHRHRDGDTADRHERLELLGTGDRDLPRARMRLALARWR